MAAASDLQLGHFCLTAGAPAERFEAAARAGFGGISLFWEEVFAARDRDGGLGPFRRRLADAGVAPELLEYIALPGADALAPFARFARDIAATSAELGCGLVHAVALGRGTPFPTLVEGLSLLVAACRDAGLRCALEFVPFITSVPSLAEAVRLLREIDDPTLGLLVDSFHFFRAGAPWPELEALGPGEIVCIQLNDGPIVRPSDDYGHECMALRRLPGDGEFDLDRFVRTLAHTAPGVPLMAEVVNEELLALPAAEAAGRIAMSMRALQRRVAETA